MTDDAGDARFEEGAVRPLRLIAATEEDLRVVAALAQDAVGKVADAAWLRRKRRFVAVLNRFRWEDREAAERARRPYERVRAALSIENTISVRARGVAQDAPEQIYNLLEMRFEPRQDTAGLLRLMLSGGAEIAIEVEALELTLTDISRPWETRTVPMHEKEPGAMPPQSISR